MKAFVSYSHKDDRYRQQLLSHLAQCRNDGLITLWHDRAIPAGSGWEAMIDEAIEDSGIIFFLVTQNFLNSRYCYEKEATRALERHDNGSARVIPILVGPCDWESAPFSRIQCIPANKPVRKWSPVDSGWRDVAIAVREVLEELQQQADAKNDTSEAPVTPTWKRFLDRSDQTARARFEIEGMIKNGRPQATCLCWHGEVNSGLAHLHDRLAHELKDVSGNRCFCVRPQWPAAKNSRSFKEMVSDCLGATNGVLGLKVRIQELGNWIRQNSDGGSSRELLLIDHPVIEDDDQFSISDLFEYLKWWDRLWSIWNPISTWS